MAYIVMALRKDQHRRGRQHLQRRPESDDPRVSLQPARPRPLRQRQRKQRRPSRFFFDISKHADGERRGPVAVLQGTSRRVSTGTSPTPPSDPIRPLGVRRRRAPKPMLKIGHGSRAAPSIRSRAPAAAPPSGRRRSAASSTTVAPSDGLTTLTQWSFRVTGVYGAI